MRLVDVDRLPVQKIGDIPVVLWEDIAKAKTHFSKVKQVAPAKMIDVRWLQKRIIQGLSETDYRSVCEIINGYIEEYKREVQNADK